jgi:antitoxin (DNA-binding transcriptional repressor) of toxin-antitoxin stability system
VEEERLLDWPVQPLWGEHEESGSYPGVHWSKILVMAASMTVSEARAGLSQMIERVMAGEEITLTRHGQAVAVVVRPDVLRVRRADHALAAAAELADVIDQGRRSPLRARPTLSEERADALIADVRAARSGRSRR